MIVSFAQAAHPPKWVKNEGVLNKYTPKRDKKGGVRSVAEDGVVRERGKQGWRKIWRFVLRSHRAVSFTSRNPLRAYASEGK